VPKSKQSTDWDQPNREEMQSVLTSVRLGIWCRNSLDRSCRRG
jgi:hypothetical protein